MLVFSFVIATFGVGDGLLLFGYRGLMVRKGIGEQASDMQDGHEGFSSHGLHALFISMGLHLFKLEVLNHESRGIKSIIGGDMARICILLFFFVTGLVGLSLSRESAVGVCCDRVEESCGLGV